jgi:hypothetical protein
MMNRNRKAARTGTGARLAAAVALVAAVHTPVQAQITQLSRTPIQDAAQLTFGYLCDDRFVLRNEGTAPVEVEYGLAKGTEHTKVQLAAREVLELESKAKQAMELWYNGKRIATAEKRRRSCGSVEGASGAIVSPLNVGDDQSARSGRYGMSPWSYYDPFFSPWGYAGLYGGLGFTRYYPSVVAYPVIVGGGSRGGGRNGGGRRGR